MIYVLLVALLVSPVGFASVIFQDDFESQSSTWDIGDGALTTPSGQSGAWNYWDRASCASYPCGKCDQLPSNANGWMTYIDSTNGRSGGKALKWVNIDACNLASNNYQGTIKWDAPNNTTKDLYWGAYWKFDPAFKMAGNNGCKIGHRVWWWDSSAAKEDFWMSIQDMRFQGASDWKLYSTYNQTTYDYVIAAPDSSGYYDGNWHWFEFHLKINSTHAASDGALEVWMDGTKYVNLQNQNFTSFNAPSGSHTGWYIKEIQTLLGDCQLQPYNFLNTTWQGFLVDDFKVSTTYIGPEGTPAVPVITSSLTASGSVGAAFSYQIVASNSPTSYGASGLPSGLTVNTSTGLISGTPTSASTTNATITAANASGSDSKTLQITVSLSAGGATLFAETFENTNFASRGWFDSPAGTLSTAEKYSGSSSLQCTIAAGGTGCSGSTPRRHAISPTDEVYISYYIKYAAGYNLDSHETYLLTNKDAGADGTTASNLAWTHLTVYLDQNNDNPWMSLQDGQNFSRSNPGVNLCAVTESRAVAGGNGNCDGIGSDSYWYDGTDYINTKWWTTTGHDLVDGAWHHVEARVKLNTVSGAIGQPNGIAQYWLDGNLVFNYTNVIFRTAANSDMLFTQYVFSPYTGSPPASSMTFYIDDLLVMDGMPAVSSFTVTPSAGANGSISPSTPQTVSSGGTIGFTVTPNGGYTASVGGTCGGALVGTTYTTNAITANCTVTASFAAETTPPVISAPLPSGVNPYGTASVTLQVTTDENATCRYHATDVAYASMTNTFASTGGKTHQQAGFTTSPGQSYTRYVRCIDALGNADTTSTAIAFSISGTNDTIVDDDDASASQSGQWAASTFYPGYYGSGYEYSPNATGHWYQWTAPLVAGAYQVFARWPAVTGRPNDVSYQITHAGGTTTITNIDQSANGNQWNLLGTYTFGTTGTVRVLSGSMGEKGTAADAVRFLAAGGVPPVLSGLSPTSNLPRTATTATLQVTTDLTATCRYMLGSGTPYSGMTPFTNTVSTTHSSIIPVVAGGVYRYCFRCQAGGGETSNESCIRFAVDPTPKKRVRH